MALFARLCEYQKPLDYMLQVDEIYVLSIRCQ